MSKVSSLQFFWFLGVGISIFLLARNCRLTLSSHCILSWTFPCTAGSERFSQTPLPVGLWIQVRFCPQKARQKTCQVEGCSTLFNLLQVVEGVWVLATESSDNSWSNAILWPSSSSQGHGQWWLWCWSQFPAFPDLVWQPHSLIFCISNWELVMGSLILFFQPFQ